MPKMKSLSFSLFDMEQAIAKRDYRTYEHQLTSLLSFIDFRQPIECILNQDDQGQLTIEHQGLVPFTNHISDRQKQDLYSRLAATITSYLSDTQYTPSDPVLIKFLFFKTILSDIFYLSCYESMDHILFNRGLMNDSLALNLKTELDIKYLYACLTLNTEITFDPKQLATALPNWGSYWYLGLLYGYHHPYNSRIENNFNLLFEAHSVIGEMSLDATGIELASSPWMICSYLDRADRHDLKVSINKAIQNWIAHGQLPPGPLKRIEKYIANTTKIKKIVVLSEQYTSKHAMYRCYHTELKLLKEKYHLTMISAPQNYDEISAQDFHKIIEVEDKAESLSDVVTKISKIEPDLIYFPSIGMAKWTIPLANMRLAKHQLMCYGHPASAFSQFIDYSYCSQPKNDWDFQQFCMEKIVPIYQGTDFVWEPHPDYIETAYEKPNDGVVRIAINSSLPKITTRFINLCKVLIQHSSVPLEFNFFLITKNDAFVKSIEQRFGQFAKVYQPAPYPEYMANLARCDLALGTFPFGGSNTNTDVSLLGIPKIFYSEECGLASYSDQTALEKMDLPDILKPQSESELLANAIYLIHDKNLRDDISQSIKNANPFDTFYKQEDLDKQREVCRLGAVLDWIEEHGSAKETSNLTIAETAPEPMTLSIGPGSSDSSDSSTEKDEGITINLDWRPPS